MGSVLLTILAKLVLILGPAVAVVFVLTARAAGDDAKETQNAD